MQQNVAKNQFYVKLNSFNDNYFTQFTFLHGEELLFSVMRSVRTLFAVFSVHLLQSRHREWTAKYPKPFTTPSGRHIDVSLSTDGVTCATRIIYSVFMTGLSRLPPLLNVQEAMRVDSWVDRVTCSLFSEVDGTPRFVSPNFVVGARQAFHCL